MIKTLSDPNSLAGSVTVITSPDFLPALPEDLPRGMACPPGLVVVDKPRGLTSNAVSSRIRRLAGQKKVGYAGTLDPMATGVLIMAIGKATRLLQYLSAHDKAYTARVCFGISTDTDDAEGEIIAATGATLTRGEIEAALSPWRGQIAQIPSKYSAIKIDGQRAYDLARAGKPVNIQARPVTIQRLELIGEPTHRTMEVTQDGTTKNVNVTEVDVVVECSAGTYIRALARDLGVDLKVGAHLTALRRISVGDYGLEDARDLAQLGDQVHEHGVLEPLGLDRAILGIFPEYQASETQARALTYGQMPSLATADLGRLSEWVRPPENHPEPEIVAVTNPAKTEEPGQVVALAKLTSTRLEPIWVLRPAKT